jgi:TP901 family phage tail tape measure protein
MSRMSLDTAIRLSAEVKGSANITKVQRSLQDLAKGSQVTARQMGTLRSATFQYARANDTTIAGIRNSVTAFRGLQEQARIGSREFTRYGAEIQKLERKLRGLDGTAQKAGASLGKNLATGLAAAGIGRALQGITAQAGRFDAELRKAAAIEGGAGSFGILKKEIEAVASVAAGTPTEVAALATALSRAGFSAKETTDSLRGIVLGAEATSVSFAEMGSIAADNMRAFGLQTAETGRVVDILTQTANKSNQTVLDLGESMKYAAPIARTLGVPIDDLAGALGLLANNGIRGSDAGTALRTGLTRLQIAAGGADSEVANLTRGNGQLTKAMATLGSSILDTSGKLKPMDQVLIGLKQSFALLSTTDQAILAKALFGTEAGSKFQALLNSTEGSITSMFTATRNAGGVAAETRKNMEGFDFSIKVLGGNIESLTNQIGGMIGAALKPLIDFLNTAIGAAQKLPEPVKAIGSAAAAAGISVLGFALAINTLKLSLGVVGSLRAYIATTAAAGNASAVAAGQVGTLGARLAAIGKIGIIVVGVSVVVNGISKLIEVQERLDAISNSSTEQFGAQVGGSALPRDNVDRLIKENRAEYQRRKKEFESVRFPGLTGQDEIAKAAMLQLDTRLAKLESMRDKAPTARNAAGTPVGAVVGGSSGGAAAAGGGGGGGGARQQSAEDRIAAMPFGREIIAAAKANSIDPALFAALVAQESGFRQSAVSSSGAIGLAQLMPGTARELGVNPRDPMQNLMGGAKYLRQQMDRFGLEGGLRAYNQGPGAQQRTPGGNSQESREYPGKVLAHYERFAGSGEGLAGLRAEGVQSQAEAVKAMQDRLQAAKDLLVTEQDRLNILAAEGALEKLIAESRIKQRNTEEEYNNKINEPGVGVEERQTLQLALQKSLQGDSIELERGIAALREDAIKPMTDITKEYGDRLAYEREYGGLLATGINPELAKQFMEIDRIAQASKISLETQIARLEVMAAELPVADNLRKSLEDQVKLKRELLGLVPEGAAEAKDDATETARVVTDREKQQADAEAKAERLKNLYKSIGSTLEEGLIGAIQTGIDGLINGTQRLDESLKEILSGVLRDIGNQLLRFAVNTALKAAAPEIFADGGVFGGGSITPFANGGVVNEPTMFKFSQGGAMQNGLLGEAGPEAILPLRRGPDGRLGVEASGMAVPFQATPAAAPNDLAVPFMRSGNSSPAAMAAEAARAMASTPLEPIRLQVESRVINGVEYVTTSQLREATEAAAMAGRDSAYDGMRNNPSIQRSLGMR